MRFFTEEEEQLMMEFQCNISKATVSIDGAAGLNAFEAIDEAVTRMANNRPSIARRTLLSNAILATVITFFTEEGMNRWLKAFPSDIQFIENDWRDKG